MSIFSVQGGKLQLIDEKKVNLEHDIQRLTEKNLETIFGLKFVSGSIDKEFRITTQEGEYHIDTLAFDESQRSFVIIEYKRDRSFSVIDQGFAYLSAMLHSKADFVLEVNEKFDRHYSKNDINWEASRLIFISPEFTSYQRSAINYKDLPLLLCEVRQYDNGVIEYDDIKPYRTSASIQRLSSSPIIRKVIREIKVVTVDDVFKANWSQARDLYQKIRDEIVSIDPNTTEHFAQAYVAYKLIYRGRQSNFVELQPQARGLWVYLDPPTSQIDDFKKIIEDCSKKGRLPTGKTRFKIFSEDEISYAVNLIKQSYSIIKSKKSRRKIVNAVNTTLPSG